MHHVVEYLDPEQAQFHTGRFEPGWYVHEAEGPSHGPYATQAKAEAVAASLDYVCDCCGSPCTDRCTAEDGTVLFRCECEA